MKRHFTKLVILSITIPLLLSSCVAGRFMCNYALLPEEHGNDFAADRKKAEDRYPGIMRWYDDLHDRGVFKDTTIIGRGGYRLHAVYAPAKGEPQGTAVIVHGYTDNHICFLNLVRMYRDDLGFNVMVPDLHYHGLSEGKAVQMGWFDRYDVAAFADVANNLWNDDFMVIHGVSMGAATVMMLSGNDHLPTYIKAFVEDCGYTSVWDQFAHNLKDSFHLPPFPILYSADEVCQSRYGWGFKHASSVKQLAKSDRPMLFIHGDKDDFVPFEHLAKNYEAKTHGYKEMWVAEGSAHAMAYKDHPVEYTEKVRSFIQTVKKMDKQ